jgi:hypothetical protein
MKVTTSWSRLLLIAVLTLANAGCLIFEKQTTVLTMDANGPGARVLLVYEGLRVGNGGYGLIKPEDIQQAKDMITQAVEGGKMFNLDAVGIIKLDVEPWQRLQQHLRLHNHGFFLDPEGKLCFYQTIDIPNRLALVKEVNALISEQMAEYLAEARKGPHRWLPGWDQESLRLTGQAIEKRYRWIEVEPGRVRFTRPATPTAVQELKKHILSLQMNRYISENAWSFQQHSESVTISLGVGDGEPIRLVSSMEDRLPNGKPESELIAHARTLRVPFHKKAAARDLISGFIHGKELDR